MFLDVAFFQKKPPFRFLVKSNVSFTFGIDFFAAHLVPIDEGGPKTPNNRNNNNGSSSIWPPL